MLNGKKTYIAVGAAILSVVGQYFSGEVVLGQAVQDVLLLLGVAGLRHGVDKKL